METKKILAADLLDLLFENRNKEYGAYELRKTYNKRITTALLVTAAVTTVALGSFFFANSRGTLEKQLAGRDIILENFDQEEKKIEPPPPPPPKVDPPPVASIQFTTPKIVDDKKVDPAEVPPQVDELETNRIDLVTQTGAEDDGTAKPIDQGRQVIVEKKVEEEEIVRTVEIEASFPGGETAWKRFLERNLNPNAPVDNGAPAGRYQVWVQFVVDKEGVISDVKALTAHGYGMEDEAVKIIKKGPQWIPAIQNGHKVKAYRKQSIVFVVESE